MTQQPVNQGRRKPLAENCNGGIWCPVDGHVGRRDLGGGSWHISHIRLTAGQQKTLRERRESEVTA